MFLMKNILVFIKVAFAAERGWNCENFALFDELGNEMSLVMGTVNETSPFLHCHPIKLTCIYSSAHPVPRIQHHMAYLV